MDMSEKHLAIIYLSLGGSKAAICFDSQLLDFPGGNSSDPLGPVRLSWLSCYIILSQSKTWQFQIPS